MKKVLLILLAATLPLMASAQPMTFGRLQEKYGERQGYTKVEITRAMLDLVNLGGKGAPAGSILGAIGGITGISILTANHTDEEFVADMKRVVVKGAGYKLLASISEDGQHTTFHYREAPVPGKKSDDSPRISELVMIMYGVPDNLIISVDGDFSIRQISSIVEQVSSGGKIDIGL